MSADTQLTLAQSKAVDFISFLAVNLVDHPEDVKVELVIREGRDTLCVRVHPDDQGQFIGKGGQTARAMRTLLAAINMRTDLNFALEIAE